METFVCSGIMSSELFKRVDWEAQWVERLGGIGFWTAMFIEVTGLTARMVLPGGMHFPKSHY